MRLLGVTIHPIFGNRMLVILQMGIILDYNYYYECEFQIDFSSYYIRFACKVDMYSLKINIFLLSKLKILSYCIELF